MVLSEYYPIPAIILQSILLCVNNAFVTPARQSLLIVLVEESDMPNAIALNTSNIDLARILGPTIDRIVLASMGEGICFLLNAVSFIAVIICLLLMKLPVERYIKPVNNLWADFHEG
jgi:predicted MFS family arabinose efflux permease